MQDLIKETIQQFTGYKVLPDEEHVRGNCNIVDDIGGI